MLRDSFDFNILGERYSLPRIDSDSQTKESILMNATLLFARKGYSSVSMRDIADTIGIKPASLYNHFGSKELLWKAVLAHAKDLYLLYFKHLEKSMETAQTFQEVLELVFLEPKKWANIFTCYAFCMIRAEQFRDPEAAEINTRILIRYNNDFIQSWFDKCVERGWARPFDTRTMAAMAANSVHMAMDVKVQECLGREPAYDPAEMMQNVQNLIIQFVVKEG